MLLTAVVNRISVRINLTYKFVKRVAVFRLLSPDFGNCKLYVHNSLFFVHSGTIPKSSMMMVIIVILLLLLLLPSLFLLVQSLLLFLKLSDRKATGLDSISSKLLKIAAPVIAASITDLFNCSISTGVFPDEWQLARVVPVFKKGTRSEVSNYRSISIIPIIAKVFEKAIYDQSYKYLSDSNMLYGIANRILECYTIP